MQRLRQKVKVGVVGGSDFEKIKEQLGDDGKGRMAARGRKARTAVLFDALSYVTLKGTARLNTRAVPAIAVFLFGCSG